MRRARDGRKHITWLNNRLKLDIITKHSAQIKVRDILKLVTGVEFYRNSGDVPLRGSKIRGHFKCHLVNRL